MEAYRGILKRVGLALIVVGALDVARMVYCISNGLVYATIFNMFAVIAGAFLLRGSLRTVRVVTWYAAFMLVGVAGLAFVVIPFMSPIGSWPTEFHIDPIGFSRQFVIASVIVAFLFWVYKQLRAAPVVAARVVAGHSASPPTSAFISAAAFVAFLAAVMHFVYGGADASKAVELARARYGDGYTFHVINLRWSRSGDHVWAELSGYDEHEIRSVKVDWQVTNRAPDPKPLAFETALRAGSEAGWKAFLESYPESAYAAAAQLELAALSRPIPQPTPTPTSSTDKTGAAPTPMAAGGNRLSELSAGTVFRDCDDCPELVRVPAGRFKMGSPSDEGVPSGDLDFEGPVHDVSIEYPLAVGKYEVTRGEFRRFVESTGYRPTDKCYIMNESGSWEKQSGRSWLDPGYVQDDSHPVVCVNWVDSRAYIRWLSRRTGKSYRLLSNAEFEYVNRAGSQSRFPWGDGEDTGCRYANVADRTAKAKYSDWTIFSCDDGYLNTAPVGRYQPNGFGLFDVSGNVWEWTQDCYHDNYSGAPSDGSAWTSGDCARRPARGASWFNPPASFRVTLRSSGPATAAGSSKGFRLARTD
jgi:formylglycine-generating enzyme required for sulfatase activity